METYMPGASAPRGWNAPETPAGWVATVSLNIHDSTSRQFNETVNIFNEKAKLLPKPDLHLPDGWHFITPFVAEQLLIANAHNRIPTFGNVRYIGEQIEEGDWQKTGEPIIIRPNGSLANGQHRCWSGYLLGKGFWSYVVNLQEDVENLFAYIDNGKTRTVGDSLHISGFNGQSATIGRAVEIVRHFDAGAYRADGASKLEPRMSNIKVMRFVQQNPKIVEAAHLMAGEHGDSKSIIGYGDVAVFFTFRVLELHGESVLEDFMDALESDDQPHDSSVVAFRVQMESDHAKDKKRMKRYQVLGALIKTFNAWLTGERVSKKDLVLRVNEDFPAFELPDESVNEAAE